MTKKFKSGDRVQFNQLYRTEFAAWIEGNEVTEAELKGRVQFYSETGKLVVQCDGRVIEAEDEKYFDLLETMTQPCTNDESDNSDEVNPYLLSADELDKDGYELVRGRGY